MTISGKQRGKLKIFMGYAPGVGKTYKMLEESQGLKSQGVDIVVGYFESHGRPDTIAKTEGSIMPRKRIDYRGSQFEEMDTDAILARHPSVCVVDEFPHTNVPGLDRAKRWEDVEVMLDAGIDVLTTMNVQHLESLNDHVWNITGIRVRETIPDWIVRQADEVVMVDLTPRAVLHRLERGDMYGREKAQKALENFFRESSLVALRELTLREAAHEVKNRIGRAPPALRPKKNTERQTQHQKVLVMVTADLKTVMVIRRARHVSDFCRCRVLRRRRAATEDFEWCAEPEHKAIEKTCVLRATCISRLRYLGGEGRRGSAA